MQGFEWQVSNQAPLKNRVNTRKDMLNLLFTDYVVSDVKQCLFDLIEVLMHKRPTKGAKP